MSQVDVVTLDKLLRQRAKDKFNDLIHNAVEDCYKRVCTDLRSGFYDPDVDKAKQDFKAVMREKLTQRYQQFAIENFLKDHQRLAEQVQNLESIAHEH